MVLIRNLAFQIAFYLGSVVYVLGALAARPLGEQLFLRVVKGWSAHHRRCARLLLGIRVEVRGTLPTHGVLIAMKHESFFEAIDLPYLLHLPVVFAKAQLLRIPLWGKAAAGFGMIAVEREQGARALRTMIAAARKAVAAGRLLIIFPEGTRVPHGTRPSLQSGFAGLYKLLGLPVVPVAVDSGPLYQRGTKLGGTITYLVGDPIPPGLPREEIEARVIEAINRLNG